MLKLFLSSLEIKDAYRIFQGVDNFGHCDNCLEVKWTILHQLRHKVNYPCVKV